MIFNRLDHNITIIISPIGLSSMTDNRRHNLFERNDFNNKRPERFFLVQLYDYSYI